MIRTLNKSVKHVGRFSLFKKSSSELKRFETKSQMKEELPTQFVTFWNKYRTTEAQMVRTAREDAEFREDFKFLYKCERDEKIYPMLRKVLIVWYIVGILYIIDWVFESKSLSVDFKFSE